MTEGRAGLAAGDLIATLAAPPRVPLAACAEAAGLVLFAEDGVVGRAWGSQAEHRARVLRELG